MMFSSKILIGLASTSTTFLTQALEVTFYENDFETPNAGQVVGQTRCGTNLDLTPINTMYGTPQNTFGQVNTVETVMISDCWDSDSTCNTPYDNPQGIGGNYAIGMLRDGEDDKLWLDFMVTDDDILFFNADLDISAIDVRGCGGPFSPAGVQLPPVFQINLIDLDTDTIIGTQTLTGLAGAPNQWTYKWQHKTVVFNRNPSQTNLRARIDAVLGSSGYAVFDNIRIWGTDTDPRTPEMGGDPHLKSWSGEWFDYQGECDLKLLHAPSFDGFHDLDIHVRTTLRRDYSFISSAALRIGDDVFVLGSYGDHALNGVDGALGTDAMIPKVGGYQIYHTPVNKKRHTYDIILSENENITLTTFKDWVSVKILHGDEERFGNVSGLMGNFHGEMVSRNGTNLHDDINALGQDWQVQPAQDGNLFHTVRAPQYPELCRLPTAATKMAARRLGETVVTMEAAEAACAHLEGAADAHTFKFCVYDVLASGDLELAQSGAM